MYMDSESKQQALGAAHRRAQEDRARAEAGGKKKKYPREQPRALDPGELGATGDMNAPSGLELDETDRAA